jgi:hypothetical protein
VINHPSQTEIYTVVPNPGFMHRQWFLSNP